MPDNSADRIQLRGCVYIDKMQPQYSALVGKKVKGDMPVEGMAQLFIELGPAIEILRAMDIILKKTNVRPGFLLAERNYGTMEVHSFSRTDIEEARRVIRDEYGPEESQLKPKIISTQVITGVDAQEAQLITNFAGTSFMIANKSLFVLEITPSCFAPLACNEAEKNANIIVVGLQWTGRTGRIYVAGSEGDVMAAKDAALMKVNKIPGRE